MATRLWTTESLIAEIRRAHAQNADLAPSAIQKTHPALFSSARSRSHFGSWRAAVEAAGLDYDEFKRVKQHWSHNEIVARIREMHAKGHDLLDPRFKVQNRSLYLAACAHRYFGSWRAALEAAGLDHETMREGRVWTKPRILRTIQQLADEGKPLGWAYIEEHEPGIYRAARRKENFGSWAGALEAAGVPDQTRQTPGAPAHRTTVMWMSPRDEAPAAALEPPGTARKPVKT